jgi:hypothetical protein
LDLKLKIHLAIPSLTTRRYTTYAKGHCQYLVRIHQAALLPKKKHQD